MNFMNVTGKDPYNWNKRLTETATFINHFYERPEDQQLVWLLIRGKKTPEPARYFSKGSGMPCYRSRAYYSLIDKEHYPTQGDSWAPLNPPENANEQPPEQ